MITRRDLFRALAALGVAGKALAESRPEDLDWEEELPEEAPLPTYPTVDRNVRLYLGAVERIVSRGAASVFHKPLMLWLVTPDYHFDAHHRWLSPHVPYPARAAVAPVPVPMHVTGTEVLALRPDLVFEATDPPFITNGAVIYDQYFGDLVAYVPLGQTVEPKRHDTLTVAWPSPLVRIHP